MILTYSNWKKLYEQSGQQSDSGWVIPFAFPSYQPIIDDPKSLGSRILGWLGQTLTSGSEGTYGKLGHGGIGIVNSKGKVLMFEFGRYPGHKAGYGLTRMRQSKISAKIKDGKITNVKDVVKGIKAVTHAPGPSLLMTYVVIEAPNVTNALDFAKNTVKVPMEYQIMDFSIADDENDANCGTFALQIVKSAGVGVPEFCAPVPLAIVQALRLFGQYGEA